MSEGARLLVVGAGSAGSRHARHLTELGVEVDLTDADDGEWSGYDGIVVATPTSMHREHALAALETGAKVLVEKPLAVSPAGLDALIEAGAGRLTVGYNLRFHRPVARLRERLGAAGTIASVRLWFGSYLPDWRPGVDYRATYSSRASLGGGILLDASHELDLLLWLFGDRWVCEGALLARRSELETDVEDVAVALLRSSDGVPAMVSLDAVSRRYRRGVEVVGDEASLRLDWAAGTLCVESADGVEVEAADDPVDDSYRAQAAAFLDLVAGRAAPAVPADEAAAVVALCDEIRATAR